MTDRNRREVEEQRRHNAFGKLLMIVTPGNKEIFGSKYKTFLASASKAGEH